MALAAKDEPLEGWRGWAREPPPPGPPPPASSGSGSLAPKVMLREAEPGASDSKAPSRSPGGLLRSGGDCCGCVGGKAGGGKAADGDAGGKPPDERRSVAEERKSNRPVAADRTSQRSRAVLKQQAGQQPTRSRLSVKGHLAVHRMSKETLAATQALLEGHNKEMGRQELRQVLGEAMDDDIFEAIFHLFDSDGGGTVNAEEFGTTMALITGDECQTPEQQAEAGSSRAPGAPSPSRRCRDSSPTWQVEAVFVMFDVDDGGSLSPDEFRGLIKATVSLNLSALLGTDVGKRRFEERLEREYSEENLAFYKAAGTYAQTADAAARGRLAAEIADEFVREGAPRQVNLPATVQKRTLAALASLTEAGGAPPPTLYDAAREEIFKLMEMDTFARFKDDVEAVDTLVSEFYASTDATPGGAVTLAGFREWALRNTQIFIFFSKLQAAARRLLDNSKSSLRTSQSFESLRDGTMADAPEAVEVALKGCAVEAEQSWLEAMGEGVAELASRVRSWSSEAFGGEGEAPAAAAPAALPSA